MGFFDKLGEKANEAYNVTAEKTTKLAREAKLRIKINEDKSEINDIYEVIGKIVYERKHESKDNEEKFCIIKELENEFTRIDVLKAEIEEKTKEILELKDKKKCIKCSAHIDIDARFCNECGEKQPEETTKNVEVISVDESNEENTEKKVEQPEDIIIEAEEKKDE